MYMYNLTETLQRSAHHVERVYTWIVKVVVTINECIRHTEQKDRVYHVIECEV